MLRKQLRGYYAQLVKNTKRACNQQHLTFVELLCAPSIFIFGSQSNWIGGIGFRFILFRGSSTLGQIRTSDPTTRPKLKTSVAGLLRNSDMANKLFKNFLRGRKRPRKNGEYSPHVIFRGLRQDNSRVRNSNERIGTDIDCFLAEQAGIVHSYVHRIQIRKLKMIRMRTI